MIKIVIVRESKKICYVETYTKLPTKPDPLLYVEACAMGLRGLISETAKLTGRKDEELLESVIRSLRSAPIESITKVDPQNN